MANIIVKKDDIDLTVNSRAKEVIIYSDKAEVKRVQNVKLEKGETTIVFSNLGAGIDEQSIKSSCAASNVKILSTTLNINNLYFFRQEENEKVYNQICDCLRDIIGSLDEKTIYALENYNTTDLRDYIKKLLNDIILTQENSITKLNEALAFLEKKYNENTLLIIAANEKLRTLHEKRALLEEKLDAIRALDKKVQNNIEVTLYAEKPCTPEVEVSYILPGISWRPSYDAKLSREKKELELSYYGEISQRTGENWEGVSVVLSTSEAEVLVEIPKLYPVYISGYEEKRKRQLIVEKRISRELKGEVEEELEEEEPVKETLPAGPQEDRRIEVIKKGVSHTFTVAAACDIPSDGRWHRFLILKTGFECHLCYETIPELMEYIYLKATQKNETGLPFLPGKIAIFRNESYMGTSHMNYTARGEEFHLSFGIDEDVKVRRIQHTAAAKEARGLSTKHVMEWEYHFILYNYKKEVQNVILKEGVYVSELKEVTVKILKDTSPDYTINNDGIVSWDVELPPDPFQHKKFVLHYTLTAPKSFDLGGI
jgi:uncharacterized protein (TIGR02231 family)